MRKFQIFSASLGCSWDHLAAHNVLGSMFSYRQITKASKCKKKSKFVGNCQSFAIEAGTPRQGGVQTQIF